VRILHSGYDSVFMAVAGTQSKTVWRWNTARVRRKLLPLYGIR